MIQVNTQGQGQLPYIRAKIFIYAEAAGSDQVINKVQKSILVTNKVFCV